MSYPEVQDAAFGRPRSRRPPRSKVRATRLAPFRQVIARVPRGRVITYGQVAAAAGFPGGARLTVRALQSAEGLPWHRVVASGGRIALPGEEGREQRLRLEIEGVRFRSGRVRIDLHGWIPRAPPRNRATARNRRSAGREP